MASQNQAIETASSGFITPLCPPLSRGDLRGVAGFQRVSPTFASLIVFSHVTTYPILPSSIFSSLTYFGEK
ncbi:MAG: hypothetical protein LBU14_02585 [Candidatus Peribacteria bacterium]|nr:hypothetical protein [Candidatus Peribacteria bacterium]